MYARIHARLVEFGLMRDTWDNVDTGNFRTATVCAGQDENIPVVDAVLRVN